MITLRGDIPTASIARTTKPCMELMGQAWQNVSNGGFDLNNTVDQCGIIDVSSTVLLTTGECLPNLTQMQVSNILHHKIYLYVFKMR